MICVLNITGTFQNRTKYGNDVAATKMQYVNA